MKYRPSRIWWVMRVILLIDRINIIARDLTMCIWLLASPTSFHRCEALQCKPIQQSTCLQLERWWYCFKYINKIIISSNNGFTISRRCNIFFVLYYCCNNNNNIWDNDLLLLLDTFEQSQVTNKKGTNRTPSKATSWRNHPFVPHASNGVCHSFRCYCWIRSPN